MMDRQLLHFAVPESYYGKPGNFISCVEKKEEE